MQTAPIIGLVIGLLILAFIGYINWYKNIKKNSVKWIVKNIYRGSLGSEIRADNLFMTFTSVLLAVGGILVLYSSLFF